MAGGIFLAYISSNFFLFILGIFFTPFFVSILRLKKNRLIPIILLIAAIGTFALQGSIFDLQMMMLFGLIGYLLRKNGFPLAPIIIARVLGPIVEENFRRSLIMSDHGMEIFWTRPIAATILSINILLLIWAFTPKVVWKRILSLVRQK